MLKKTRILGIIPVGIAPSAGYRILLHYLHHLVDVELLTAGPDSLEATFLFRVKNVVVVAFLLPCN